MRKRIKIGILVLGSIIILGFIHLFTHVPGLSEKHGVVEAKLFLAKTDKQPLFVGFGGGGGGNDWVRHYLKGKRDSLNNMGYAVLAIGYFKSNGTPKHLDRVAFMFHFSKTSSQIVQEFFRHTADPKSHDYFRETELSLT